MKEGPFTGPKETVHMLREENEEVFELQDQARDRAQQNYRRAADFDLMFCRSSRYDRHRVAGRKRDCG